MSTCALEGISTGLHEWLEELARIDGKSVQEVASYVIVRGITAALDDFYPKDPVVRAAVEQAT
jgi:hypothetical protein